MTVEALSRLSGPEAMEGDWAMLERAEQGEVLCRVYTWDGLWVSLGRNQIPAEALVAPSITPHVLRPTGGSAVLHGHDVTISIAMPAFSESGGVGGSYRRATRPLLAALNLAGVRAELAQDVSRTKEHRGLADCFASTSRNDIVDARTGLKVCGCALRRTRNGILIQSSIPCAPPLRAASEVIVGGVITALSAVVFDSLAAALRDVAA